MLCEILYVCMLPTSKINRRSMSGYRLDTVAASNLIKIAGVLLTRANIGPNVHLRSMGAKTALSESWLSKLGATLSPWMHCWYVLTQICLKLCSQPRQLAQPSQMQPWLHWLQQVLQALQALAQQLFLICSLLL